jgi:hypothetical protein
MNSKMIYGGLGIAALLLLGAVWAVAQPKGDAVTLKGEVVDLWCYTEGGAHGADHKQCGIACAKAGNPIGLLTDKGDVYLLMGMKNHESARDMLIEKMADTVTIDGTLVKKGGIQVVYVSAMK